MKKQQWFLLKPSLLIGLLVFTLLIVQISRGESNIIAGSADAPVYHSPFDLAYSPDGKYLAVSNATAASLDVIELGKSSVAWQVALNGQPRGLAWHENQTGMKTRSLLLNTVPAQQR